MTTDETTGGTTDETTSHSAMPPKNGGQAAGYSHLTRLSKNDIQVIGYSHSAKSPKDGDISRWLTATKWLDMLRCVKNFLLTYNPYAARQNEVSV
jgi:hypothetical protein